MLAKFKSWPLRPCVFRECLMLPFDTHHFVPDVQGGVFVFVFVFLYSFCATRFQTLPVSHKVSWPQVLQEMRRRCVQSRLNTCTDMIPPFPVVIAWYFVWLPNKCRHAAKKNSFLSFFFFSVTDPRFSGARFIGTGTIVDTRHISTS